MLEKLHDARRWLRSRCLILSTGPRQICRRCGTGWKNLWIWFLGRLEALARRRILLPYVAMEAVASIFIMAFFGQYETVALFAWPSHPDQGVTGLWLLTLGGVQLLHSFIGVFGVHKRRIPICRLYWLSMPIVFFVALMVGLPLLRIHCQCFEEDYWQCKVLTDFSHGHALKNIFLRPPPKQMKPLERYPVSAPGSTRTGLALIAPPGDVDIREPGFTQGCPENDGDHMCGCRCRSRCRPYYTGHETWPLWPPLSAPTKIGQRAWCPIVEDHENDCEDNNILVYEYVSKPNSNGKTRRFKWTADLCPFAGTEPACHCQDIDTCDMTGGQCQVDADSLCPDASNAWQPPWMEQHKHPFWSTVACQMDQYAAAIKRCMALRIMMLGLVVCVGLFAVPGCYAIYLFVQNHCGDVVEVQRQYNVEFSDDEGEDDFHVDASTHRSTMRWSTATSAVPLESFHTARPSNIELETRGSFA
eukprot:TRINITY_DN17547_c0_g4_i1.p1 TRINITY_DN17547_c0_g4~~TRINITY_DN17547_c0_g4_i1.p1  ORF type:complete len:473 (-),score=34.78 TRINITY_DN17547_c0_g4_i1:156-1574(-)